MTIYALSTGPGVSGIAVIRISGLETAKVVKSITNKQLPQPRVATLRKIKNINTHELIDEGIILWFPGPESYTGEDMAEIHVHGGKAVILAVQNEISKINPSLSFLGVGIALDIIMSDEIDKGSRLPVDNSVVCFSLVDITRATLNNLVRTADVLNHTDSLFKSWIRTEIFILISFGP